MRYFSILLLTLSFLSLPVHAKQKQAYADIDQYINQLMSDWNTPGVAIGVIQGKELVYAKGFGYRNVEKQLPVTPQTIFPIASNSKLFTAITLGMLVDEGKLEWDSPISDFIPSIKFSEPGLYHSITLRDMLSHRSGLSRMDFIWDSSDFGREELFSKVQYLKKKAGIRQTSIYNNMMYIAAGHSLELLTEQSWEGFMRQNVLAPLQMDDTVFSIADLRASNNHAQSYYQINDKGDLAYRPTDRSLHGIGPAGNVVSSIEDMSHWLIALANNGQYKDTQVIAPTILNETLRPATPYANATTIEHGYDEILNRAYGMGRTSFVYKGHWMASHGGTIGGYHSYTAVMPNEQFAIVVLVNAAHAKALTQIIGLHLTDLYLGVEPTDFNQRELDKLEERKQKYAKRANEWRDKKVANTKPSHPLTDYTGVYNHPAYGDVTISLEKAQMLFEFHKIELPLNHYHYNRFDTTVSPFDGQFSMQFLIDMDGNIEGLKLDIDSDFTTFSKVEEPAPAENGSTGN